MTKSGWGGDHLFKGGVQYARLFFDDLNDIQNALYLLYQGGKPAQVREFNSPSDALNVDTVLGFFGQDTWTVGRNLTLNLGLRYDHNVGTLPANSNPGGPYVAPKSIPESTPIKQNLTVWRTGAVFDPFADGKTALKASYSRYGLQVGIDRVLNINPLQSDFADLHVDRSEQRPHRAAGRDQPVFRVHRHHQPLRERNRTSLAVLRRGLGGYRAPDHARHARRRDVLLPHQPGSDRYAQPGRSDLGLQPGQHPGAERP